MTVDHAFRLARTIIEEQGRMVKTIGDGVVAIFEEAGAAYDAAHRLVETMEKERRLESPEAVLSIRAAVHWGELFVEEADVYGDLVNTTARLLGLASSPCVLMTEAFVERLPPDVREVCGIVGSFELRGKTDPLAVYARLSREVDELALEDGELRAYRYDTEHSARIRLVRHATWPQGTDAFACSRSSYRSHFEGLSISETPQRKGRASVVHELQVGNSLIHCWVYDFNEIDGGSGELLATFHAWAARRGYREVALRFPHRFRGMGLMSQTEAVAAAWLSEIVDPPRRPVPALLSLVYPRIEPDECGQLAYAAARGLAHAARGVGHTRVEGRVRPGMRWKTEGLEPLRIEDDPQLLTGSLWFEALVTRGERMAMDPSGFQDGT